ncbi:pilus assembly protein CpaF [Actinobacillus delphinicola]|uniref:Tight adherence protein A n=1 Tax=Actinobacillus delphinicola TaxID=51161 RepID=A0A448TVE6_9PAST|nr:CpaF family protein [Actinobacillus delphinicola]MDG6898038.1 pilus assembly protein CpaF [Actinobacillus delphinicola]VEJ09904.1 tight adherence protein A [Actinobacillus delphinicola]
MLTQEQQILLRQRVLSNLKIENTLKLKDDRDKLIELLLPVIYECLQGLRIATTPSDSTFMAELLADELMGYGPLRELMEDETINDILVNGPENIWVERQGILEKTDKHFLSENQLNDIARRLVSKMGRRIDDSSPLVDSRLPDGSRLNVVIPPIALDGTTISIRKFSKTKKTLQELRRLGTLSLEMANFLIIAARAQVNIIVAGGTGSGKTTLLNALSQYIAPTERVITLEDTAELKLNQPHVVRLETRPPSVEHTGEVSMQDLVINALRMRPERIIIGECRGAEAFQMLQAMNTGHDGSMSTLHANSPRDALSRLESMVMMSNAKLPLEAIRRHVSSAVHILVQASRLNDGSRKITNITEVMGMESGNIVLQDIFSYEIASHRDSNGKIVGTFKNHGLLSSSTVAKQARIFNLLPELNSIFGGNLQ